MFSADSSKANMRRLLILLLAGGLLAGSASGLPPAPAEAAAGPSGAKQGQPAQADPASTPVSTVLNEPYYADLYKTWQAEGAKPAASALEISAAAPSGRSDEAVVSAGSYAGKTNVLLWNGTADGWVEYRFDVPADALYEVHVSYLPITGNGSRRPVVWNVAVDGRRPFREASSIMLYRHWKDVRPIKKDEDGNDIRPRSEEIPEWSVLPLADSGGAYAEPLQWFFGKGAHTLRFEGSEPVALESIRLVPAQKLKPYAEAAAAYPQAKTAEAPLQTLQAEELQAKNDSAIQITSDTDPRTVPEAAGRITFNTVGGAKSWSNQNQEIAWTFEVPATGRYKLAMRSRQNFISQKASYRTIRIDGNVPFQEMLVYRFPYSTGWAGTVLQDEGGSPYEFHLEKGKHTLSMAVTHAPFTPVLLGIEQITDLLGAVDQDLIFLTGGQTDKNRTWRVAQDLPDLPERLQKAADRLTLLAEKVKQANGRTDSISQGLETSATDIRKLLEKVDDIPYHSDQIAAMKEKISQYTETLVQQPLQLDEIYIAPAESKFPNMKASWLAKLAGVFQNFLYTFRATDRLSDMDDQVLNVWVNRGRDYVTELQELTDELFTPETGVKVKVNILPNTQLLLLSNAAGIQPDIALGLPQDLPVDYAIRNSVEDLSLLPGFADIYKRFSPGSWLPLYYNKGYYALPETQSFQVLYYRKDILDRLGLPIPETWDDVYDMLPALQQNFMNFFVNPNQFTTFFYQNNTELYEKNGLRTAVDSPEGFKAFRQWTDLFNIYAIEREVPSFYQHFRKGTIPIGISDYNMYIQLSAAAPELNGRWGIALIPGVRQKDGTVVRWAGGGQNTGVIFKASKKKEQAWEFLKWWTSADVQERYGTDLEAYNGVAFKWNTSNIEAFSKLPWKREDANIILKQWQWYKDIPNVPGGYFLDRELKNAWNRTVVDGVNYRTSLESAVLEINRELRRKQEEFGFIDSSGNQLKSMDLPRVDKPWEGVNGYVR